MKQLFTNTSAFERRLIPTLFFLLFLLFGCAPSQNAAKRPPSVGKSGESNFNPNSVEAQVARGYEALEAKSSSAFDDAVKKAFAAYRGAPGERAEVGKLLLTAARNEADSGRRGKLLAGAAGELSEARNADPNDTDAAYALGLALYYLNHAADAQRHLEFCVERNKADRPAVHLLARCLMALEDPTGAIRVIEHSATGTALEAEDWEIIGECHFLHRENALAVDAYNKALSTQPGHAWTWNNLGLALEEQDRKEEAQRCFERSKELRRSGAGAQSGAAAPLKRLREPL